MLASSNLAEILEATPRRRVEFDLALVDVGKLTLLELLDAGEATGIPFEDFRESLVDPSRQAHLFYAIAWVILRRLERELSYEEVCEFDLIVTGEIDEAEMERTTQRAKSVVAVAQVARVTPSEALNLTVSEVEAAVNLQERRNRASRRRK